MADNFYGITNTGRIRDNNEDTFLAEKLPNGWIAACVIDGVGGYEGGEVAAEIAKETIWQKVQQLSADPVQTLQESLFQANKNIYNEKLHNRGKDQMACVLTLAVVDIESNQFHYAHVGDTRLYLLRDQSLVKVTKDHSFVGFLEDSGRLSEKEAMAHPKRNEINKALGFDPQLDVKSDYIETGSSPFLPGDMLLLCSDGLSDLVKKSEMTSILLSSTSLQEKGHALVDAANIAGGKDNITVVIVHNNKKPLKIKATKPVITKKKESSEAVAPVAEVYQPVAEKSKKSIRKKGNNAAIWGLSFLCLLLAGALVYLWSTQKGDEELQPVQSVVQTYTPNERERILRDSLGLTAGRLVLTDTTGGNIIILGDTLFVRQDTMRINGNGLVLQSDSAFKGPALVASLNNKVLLLENITFKDFPTAILLQGKGLQLRNVRFENCAVPVQHNLYLPADSSLRGAIRDTFSFTRNSIPQ